MTVQQAKLSQADLARERDDFLAWTNGIVDQVRGWADQLGWATHQDAKTINEGPRGTYQAPFLRVRTPNGEVHVDPIARWIMGGGRGRVDLQGWPSLNRVALVRTHDGMEIVTDSNVPLRQPWDRTTFVQLAEDLTLR